MWSPRSIGDSHRKCLETGYHPKKTRLPAGNLVLHDSSRRYFPRFQVEGFSNGLASPVCAVNLLRTWSMEKLWH